MRLFKQPRSPYYFFDARINGKRQRISTQEISRRAAERVAANYLLKIGAGDSVKRSRQIPTLQQFSERFFAWADNTSSLEPKTKKYYRYGWRLVSFTALAQTLIDQIDSEITDTLVFERPVIDRRTSKETGEWIVCGKTYSQQALRTLRVMLGQAHEWKILKQKPSFKIGKTPGRDGIITPEIEAVILRELNGYRTRRAWLAVLTVMDTGCRPSEVFAMRIENIDWAGRRIWIPEGKTAQARRWLSPGFRAIPPASASMISPAESALSRNDETAIMAAPAHCGERRIARKSAQESRRHRRFSLWSLTGRIQVHHHQLRRDQP